MASEKQKNQEPGVTWAQAARDVLIAAINRGQLIGLFLGLVVLLLIYKLPENEVGPIVNFVLTKLADGYLGGWAAFVFGLGGWYVHVRKLRIDFVAAVNELKLPSPQGVDKKGGG